MKIQLKIIFLLLFLISLGFKAQEISGRITYNVSLNLTIEQVTERYKGVNRKVPQSSKDRINSSRDILAFLEFDKQHSIQSLEDELKNDGYRGKNMTQKGAGNNKLYYTENAFVQKTSIVECKILEECVLIEQPKAEWKIFQETKIIGSYLCYRAEYQNPIYKYKKPIAWFAPKIPASYGPKIFTGLPGLILELEDNTVTYTAIKIELNPQEKISIEKPEGKALTQEKYEALLKKTFPAFYKKIEDYKTSN